MFAASCIGGLHSYPSINLDSLRDAGGQPAQTGLMRAEEGGRRGVEIGQVEKTGDMENGPRKIGARQYLKQPNGLIRDSHLTLIHQICGYILLTKPELPVVPRGVSLALIEEIG